MQFTFFSTAISAAISSLLASGQLLLPGVESKHPPGPAALRYSSVDPSSFQPPHQNYSAIYDSSGQMYYIPPANSEGASPKKRGREHASSISSNTSGAHAASRARMGSLSSGASVPTPLSSFNAPHSGIIQPPNTPACFVGNASHLPGQFPYGLTMPSPSSDDPFMQGYTPGRFATEPGTSYHPMMGFTPSPGPPVPSAEDSFYLHLSQHPQVRDVWPVISSPTGMNVEAWLHLWGMRLCPQCDYVMLAGELSDHLKKGPNGHCRRNGLASFQMDPQPPRRHQAGPSRQR